MKQGLTLIGYLLDRSGSMDLIKTDTIGGFNQMMEEQKKEPGDLRVTLASFASADDYTELFSMAPIADVPKLTLDNYRPMGNTALNDALVKLVQGMGRALEKMPESERPERVLVITQTDGEENNSQEYRGAAGKLAIKEIITHQEQVYGWKFLYVGANQDSFAESQAYGMSAFMNFAATPKGSRKMSHKVSSTLSAYRSSGKLDVDDDDQNKDEENN